MDFIVDFSTLQFETAGVSALQRYVLGFDTKSVWTRSGVHRSHVAAWRQAGRRRHARTGLRV